MAAVRETEEEAAEILKLLEEGAEFTVLARERSLDRATAPLGGEVGWFTRAMMTPVFSKAAFGAEPGSMAPAFQSEFGWHVLEVLERQSTESVPFGQVSRNIEEFLRMRTIDSSLRALEDESQVVYFRPEEAAEFSSAPPDLSDLEEKAGAAEGGEGAPKRDEPAQGGIEQSNSEPESMR